VTAQVVIGSRHSDIDWPLPVTPHVIIFLRAIVEM